MRILFILLLSLNLFSEESVALFPLDDDGEIFYQEIISKQDIKKEELFSSLKNQIQSPNFYFRTLNENGMSDAISSRTSTDLSKSMRSIIDVRSSTNTITETKNENLTISITQFLPGNSFNPRHIFINYKLRLDVKDEAFRISLYNFNFQYFPSAEEKKKTLY